jgi:hypothetical protein
MIDEKSHCCIAALQSSVISHDLSPGSNEPHPQLEHRRSASRIRAFKPDAAMKLEQAGIGAEGAQEYRVSEA